MGLSFLTVSYVAIYSGILKYMYYVGLKVKKLRKVFETSRPMTPLKYFLSVLNSACELGSRLWNVLFYCAVFHV